jgi:hypothetical protein
LISFSLSAISFTCFLFHPSPLVKNIVRFVCMSLSCITVTLWKRKGARITQPSSDIHLLSIYLLTFLLPRPSRGQGVASPDCASRILHSSLFTLHSSLVSSSSPPPDRQRCHHKQRTWYHGSGCRADARRHAGSPAAGENEGVKPHSLSAVWQGHFMCWLNQFNYNSSFNILE